MSHLLAEEDVGSGEIDERELPVYFGRVCLRRFQVPLRRIEDAAGPV